MTDDLTTMLRDAGREPTIDLDVDAVHTRGRRRAVGRNVAIGTGALALVGVLGFGVATLLDQPDTPIVGEEPGDAAPPVDGSDTPDDPAVRGDVDVTAAALAAEHAVTVHELVFVDDGFDVRTTSVTGMAQGRWTDGATQLGDPVVADDGGLWSLTPDGRTVRRDPATGEVATIAGPEPIGNGWMPIGHVGDGAGSVLVIEVGIGDTSLAEPSDLYVATADGARPFAPFPAVEATALTGDESAYAAAAEGEQLVALVGAGESYRVLQLPSGADGRVLVEDGGTERWLADVAVDGRHAWVLGNDMAMGPTLRRVSLEDGSVVEVDLPDGAPTARRVSVAPDGSLVAVGVSTDDDSIRTFVVDAATVDGSAPQVRLLDTVGLVDLLADSSDDEAPLAGCATDEDAGLNDAPSGDGGQVWWLCSDATSLLAKDVAYPFVAVELFSGGDGTVPADGPGAIIRAWAEGPGDDLRRFGLQGVLGAEVATVADVTVEGSTVVVDLTAGPQVGVLGTTYASGAFIQGLVGTALQYEELDTVRITLDGSCEGFSGLIEGEGCFEYDRSWAPWNQGDPFPADAAALEDGLHPVYVHGIDTGGRTLTFDLIQFLTGEEASAAYDGPEPDGPPNDYVILNENDLLRTMAVAVDVEVQLVDLMNTSSAEPRDGTWEELPGYFAEGPSGDGGSLWYAPFWLTVEDGVITAIEEQYIP